MEFTSLILTSNIALLVSLFFLALSQAITALTPEQLRNAAAYLDVQICVAVLILQEREELSKPLHCLIHGADLETTLYAKHPEQSFAHVDAQLRKALRLDELSDEPVDPASQVNRGIVQRL